MSDGIITFASIPALKAACASAGNFFFTKGAMQFFKSRVETGIIGGAYFITSEQFQEDAREFTIRKAVRLENGKMDIETIGDRYATKREARSALQAILKSN